MARTTTTYITFEMLKARGPSAVTIVKLMMACNDLALANRSLGEWKKDQPPSRKSRQNGAGMYFIRIELGHLFEGLKLIDDIRSDPSLMMLVSTCDQRTRHSFDNLEPFLTGGSNRPEFERLIGRVRHNLTFHYDEGGKLIQKAISDRAARAETRTSSLTRGDRADRLHFKVVDDVVNSIVGRQIWKIPMDANVEEEADKVVDRIHQIFLWFMDFSEEFIWRYCRS